MAYFKLEKERVVYLDIDDSTALWIPTKYKHNADERIDMHDEHGVFQVVPHYANINFVKKLKAQGYGVVAWSAAGASWAETVIKKFGLEDLPDIIISKPELCVDDLLDPKRIITKIVWINPDTGEFYRNE